MMVMDKPEFEIKTYVRFHPRAKQSLEGVVSALRARNRAKWFGKRITQEALVNALCMWIETLDPSDVELGIESHLEWLEADMTSQAGPPASLYAKPTADTDLDVKSSLSKPARTGRSAKASKPDPERGGSDPTESENTRSRRSR